MALEKQIAEYHFAKGLNEHMDALMLPADQPAECTNSMLDKAGALSKRFGFDAIASTEATNGTSRATAARFLKRAGELNVIEPGTARLRSVVRKSTVAATAWQDKSKDFVPECTVDRQTLVARAQDSVAFADCCATNGYELYVYQVGSGASALVEALVVDGATGAPVFASGAATFQVGAMKPKCLVVGTTFYLFYAVNGNNQIRVDILPTATSFLAWDTPATLISDYAGGDDAYDVWPLSDGFLIAYKDNQGTPAIQVKRFSASFVSQATTTISEVVTDAIAVAGKTSQETYVAWYRASDRTLRATVRLTSDLTQVTAPSTIQTLTVSNTKIERIGISPTDTEAYFVWDETPNSSALDTTGYRIHGVRKGTDLVNIGVAHGNYWVHLASKPWRTERGRVCAVVCFFDPRSGGTQYHYYVAALTATSIEDPAEHLARPIAAFARREAFGRAHQVLGTGGRVAAKSNLPFAWPRDSNVATSDYSGNDVIYPGLMQQLVQIGLITVRISLDRCRFSFEERGSWQSVELGQATHTAMGLVSQYDGRGVHENNFCYYPWLLNTPTKDADGVYLLDASATQSSGGGTGLENGTYFYKVIYEARDHAGQLYRSTTSEAAKAIVSDSGWSGQKTKVTLKIPYLDITTRQDFENQYPPLVVIRVYRTKVGTAEPFYEIEEAASLYTYANPAPNVPSPATAGAGQFFLTFADDTSDANIAVGAGKIYTDGGTLDHTQPVAARFIETHKNRLWLAGCEKGREVHVSNEYVTGEGVAFTEFGFFTVEGGHGDITGIAAMDDALVVFKSRAIYRIYGSGSNDLGQQNDLQEPSLITTEVGCTDGHYIVKTSMGLVFRNERGWYLLGRDFSLTLLSAPVETRLKALPETRAATALPDRQLVVISSALSTSGLFFVLDLQHQQWFVWTRPGVPPPTAFDCAEIDGTFYALFPDGAVWVENPTSFADPGSTYIDRTTATAWFQPAGAAGLARVWRVILLAKFVSSHKLTIDVQYDYREDDAWQNVGIWTGAQLTEIKNAASPREQLEMILPIQVCTAFRLRILETVDPVDSVEGEGNVLRAIRILYGVKQKGKSLLRQQEMRG